MRCSMITDLSPNSKVSKLNVAVNSNSSKSFKRKYSKYSSREQHWKNVTLPLPKLQVGGWTYCSVKDEHLQMKNCWNSFPKIEVCLKFSRNTDHKNPLRLLQRNDWQSFLAIK